MRIRLSSSRAILSITIHTARWLCKRALSRVFVFECDEARPAFAGGYLHPSGEHVVISVGDRYHHVKAPR